jgi:hypothetical protein
MTEAEKEARARSRAREQHVHIFAVPGRPGVYTTKSKTDPAERYDLVARDGIIACSCRGFEYHKVCKHAEQLKSRLAREAVQAARQVLADAAPARRAVASDLYA